MGAVWSRLTEGQALLLFLGLLVACLVALVRYERRPGRRVVGTVARLWYENIGRLSICWIEVEVGGTRQSFTCAPEEYGKVAVGDVVRLQLKGSYVEHIRRIQ